MRDKRAALFGLAAGGALLALLGACVVVWAWSHPGAVAEEQGTAHTEDDARAALRLYHLGTIGGTIATALGIALAMLGFKLLSRDLDRRRREIGIGRR